MMGIAVIVGAILAGNPTLTAIQNMILGFITGFTLTASSMVINDFYDREIDSINEPNRPIPSGIITIREALIFSSILSIIGFVSSVATSTLVFLISIIAWIVCMTYSTIGKRKGLYGNFLVSTCVTIPIMYGNIMIENSIDVNILLLATLIFFANTGREITKGIVDVTGDKQKKVNTLAVVYGEQKAAVIAVLFFLVAVILSPLPLLLEFVTPWFIPGVVVTDFGLIKCSISLLQDSSRNNAKKVKNQVLIWFIPGLLAFFMGNLK
jgi:geranylgeranylglycerol-phosphate geranylgeranyltransferase